MKQYLIKFLLVSSLVTSFLLIPQTLLAQTSSQQIECARLKALIEGAGNGQGSSVANLPAYCDPMAVYSKITFWLYYIIGMVAVISIMYAGYMYMTARDNEAQLKKSKSMLLWTIVGVVIAVLATLIVGTVINLIVDNKIF